MIICFDCSTRTKSALDELLAVGQYADYGEAIATAIDNQLLLHEAVGNRGAVVIHDDQDSSQPETGTSRSSPRTGSGEKQSIRRRSPEGSKSASKRKSTMQKKGRNPERAAAVLGDTQALDERTNVSTNKVPEIFSLDGLEGGKLALAPEPGDVWAVGQVVPVNRWILGQYNKLLPAKASCRALNHLLVREGHAVSVDQAAREIADSAAVLGSHLALTDAGNGTHRDDALSTAFPNVEDDEERGQKSRLRYANQFVASVNKYGQLSGLLVDFKLVNKVGRDGRVALTEPGWNFAKLPNPVLENLTGEAVTKFSEHEIRFLLQHIRLLVPAEDFAYRAILQAVLEGVNTPEKLDAYLQHTFPIDSDSRELTDSFLSSQRSGAVSRMADLNLIARVRDGVRVSYLATPTGEDYAKGG